MEQDNAHWESVHVCPNCGTAINLADINFHEVTTGIVLCPRCEWSGRIEIQIVSGNSLE